MNQSCAGLSSCPPSQHELFPSPLAHCAPVCSSSDKLLGHDEDQLRSPFFSQDIAFSRLVSGKPLSHWSTSDVGGYTMLFLREPQHSPCPSHTPKTATRVPALIKAFIVQCAIVSRCAALYYLWEKHCTSCHRHACERRQILML